MKIFKIWLSLTIVGIMAACVSIPKETVVLSDEMGSMIASAKTSHLALLNAYETERRGRIDDYMSNTWTPRLIEKMMAAGDLLGDTCEHKDSLDAVKEIQGFVEAAARQIYAKRKELTDALDLVMMDLREAVRVHYATLGTSNQVVTRNLKSVQKNDNFMKGVLDKAGVTNVTPLRQASKDLDSLMK